MLLATRPFLRRRPCISVKLSPPGHVHEQRDRRHRRAAWRINRRKPAFHVASNARPRGHRPHVAVAAQGAPLCRVSTGLLFSENLQGFHWTLPSETLQGLHWALPAETLQGLLDCVVLGEPAGLPLGNIFREPAGFRSTLPSENLQVFTELQVTRVRAGAGLATCHCPQSQGHQGSTGLRRSRSCLARRFSHASEQHGPKAGQSAARRTRRCAIARQTTARRVSCRLAVS